MALVDQRKHYGYAELSLNKIPDLELYQVMMNTTKSQKNTVKRILGLNFPNQAKHFNLSGWLGINNELHRLKDNIKLLI